ncbi:hypothetical protein CHUAL_005394 [Chamberlinius hualienensis]
MAALTACEEKSLKLEAANDSTEDEESDHIEVDIPVVKKIWDSKYTIIGRLIWATIITACTIIMITQVINRIHYYKSSPLSIDMQLRHNSTMAYPAVTICRSDFFNDEAYEEIKQEISNISGIEPASSVTLDDILKYMDIMQLWEKFALPLDEMVRSCFVEGSKKCTDVGQWDETVTVSGICYTLSFNYSFNVSGAVYGLNIVLGRKNISANEDEEWKLLLHDSQSSPKLEIITEGVVVYPLYNMDMRVNLREYNLESTPAKTCGDIGTSQCQINCIAGEILEKTNCRLPFMNGMYENVSYCNYVNLSLANEELNRLLMGNESRCICIPRCISLSYEISTDTIYFPDRPVTRVRIFYSDFDYTSYNEYMSFSFVALLSDIGGTLGLFLGFSFMTLLEIFEILILKIKKVHKHKKKLKEDAKKSSNSKTNKKSKIGILTIKLPPSIDEPSTFI